MANGFRVLNTLGGSNKYLGAGNDSNPGTPDAPYASLQKFFSSAVLRSTTANQNVIGAGVYKGAVNAALGGGTSGGANARDVVPDGYAKLKGDTTNSFLATTGQAALNFGSLTSGVLEWTDFANVTIGATGATSTITNIILRPCNFTRPNNQLITFSTFYDVIDTTSGTTITASLTNCNLMGVTAQKNVSGLKNVYTASGTKLTLIDTITAANCDYNCIDGKLKLASDPIPGTGDAQGFMTLAQFKAAHPTLLLNSFSSDGRPTFNSIMLDDLNVPANSILLKTGENGANIGRVSSKSVAFYAFDAGSPFNLNTVGVNSFNLNQNAAGIGIDNLVTGYGWMQTVPMSSGTNGLMTPLEFPLDCVIEANPDFTGGHPENMNVPDSDNGTAHPDNVFGSGTYNLSANRNPNRFSVKARWSQQRICPPYVKDPRRITAGDPDGSRPLDAGELAQWDNQGRIPAGDFAHFSITGAPLIDAAGYGTGSWQYNPATGQEISFFWVQFEIWLTNQRVK